MATSLDQVFGEVTAPPGVADFDAAAPGSGVGIIVFASTLIRLATIVAGIWVMFNFIMAGFIYITSEGDSSAHQKVQDRLTMSVIGLALIVGSYTIAAIIGFIFFGDAGYILSPTITGPGGGPAAPPRPAGVGPLTP